MMACNRAGSLGEKTIKLDRNSPGIVRRFRTAILLQTHFLDRSLSRFFEQLVAQCGDAYQPIILMHVLPGTVPPATLSSYPHHLAPSLEVRNPLYRRKSGILTNGRHDPGWGLLKGGHSELVPLHFFARYPEFDSYWMIEYDVRFSGNWGDFLRHFEASGADLLATCLRNAEEDPGWVYWDTLEAPASQAPLRRQDRMSCFLPLYRLSRAAMAALDEGYREGWGGHAETTIPTMLKHKGFELEDIGSSSRYVKPINRGRWYSNDPKDLAGAPGSFVARPVRFSMGREPDMLWHPVKPVLRTLVDKAKRGVGRVTKPLRRRSVPGS
jgi:hypothetical protein